MLDHQYQERPRSFIIIKIYNFSGSIDSLIPLYPAFYCEFISACRAFSNKQYDIYPEDNDNEIQI